MYLQHNDKFSREYLTIKDWAYVYIHINFAQNNLVILFHRWENRRKILGSMKFQKLTQYVGFLHKDIEATKSTNATKTLVY